MKIIPISRSGQIALPAAVRRRWGTRRVQIVDNGGELVVSPVPDDPVAAAAGALGAWRTPGTDEIRRRARLEEREREGRRDRTPESRP
jgi:bifunctional DNA-binding transcriptional regulator/antitoxin component of YhaV-PrlF toxin-antitoxin module